MLAAQYFVLHVYGQEQQKQYYMAMTPEQVQALNDCYYQEFMYKQLLEQKKQECLQSPQKSRNMDDGQFFTSFLYSENSFLTPWSWNPDQPPRTEENRRMMFQPVHAKMPSARIKEEECSRQEED
ncbi:unnamed protein product [Dovyalis caffra]|uniref:Uncharacterized protein n=1 Tax=Dovyalis caffra TaxID=77055 RepID=A0AAV1S3Y8_9ROSI|nr:unnamed protein product [Dovyalis caffra]